MKNQPEKRSLSSVAYEKILSSIISGDFSVNQKLPTEADLCECYGISRPVLREALARLREDNLVVSRRGSGSYVINRPDNAVLEFARITSIADIQRCFEFRTDVESSAAGLAAVRRTTEQLDIIWARYEAINQDNRKHDRATNEDFSFHLAITEASNNHYYTTVLKSLNKSIKEGMNITRGLSLLASEDRLKIVQDEHLAVVNAIVEKDQVRAADCMRNHLERARRRMFEGGSN